MILFSKNKTKILYNKNISLSSKDELDAYLSSVTDLDVLIYETTERAIIQANKLITRTAYNWLWKHHRTSNKRIKISTLEFL